jgi:hypothetical protein
MTRKALKVTVVTPNHKPVSNSTLTRSTERRGRVVNTPASYSGGSGFNLGLETGYHERGFSWFFSVPPGEYRNNILKLGHDSFLPNPFPIYHSLITLSFDVM